MVARCGPSWPTEVPRIRLASSVDSPPMSLAQLAEHLLALLGQLLLALLPDPGHLAVGLGAHLVPDALGVGAGLVPDRGGLLAGLGQRGLVALLGLLEPSGRLLAVLDLLAVHLSRSLIARVSGGTMNRGEDEQDDQEQQQLDEDGRVGDQEVGVLLGRQHSCHDRHLSSSPSRSVRSSAGRISTGRR